MKAVVLINAHEDSYTLVGFVSLDHLENNGLHTHGRPVFKRHQPAISIFPQLLQIIFPFSNNIPAYVRGLQFTSHRYGCCTRWYDLV